MQIKENMRRLLAEDKSVLSRRDDFLNKLENLSTEPKDFAAIRRAVQSVNIAEMFLANDGKSLEVKKEVVKSLRAKLVDIGMQDARIEFIVDAFAYALNWEIEEKPDNKNNAVIDKKVEKVSPKISLAKEKNIPKTEINGTLSPVDKNIWTCACGTENSGKLCSNCGKPFQKLQAKNEKNNIDDVAEKFSQENIEKYIKDNQITEKIQTAAKTAKEKTSDAIEQALDTGKPNQIFDIKNVNNANNIQNINTQNTQNIQNTEETNISYSAVDTRNSYCSFEGRMNRKAYCIMGIKCLGFYLLLSILASLLAQGSDSLGIFIFCVITIAFTICNYSLTVRRLHDLNHSGWLALIMLIPYVNLIAALYIIFAPGTDGPNQYGEDPLKL